MNSRLTDDCTLGGIDPGEATSPVIAACLFGFPFLEVSEKEYAREKFMAIDSPHTGDSFDVDYIGEPCLSECFCQMLANRRFTPYSLPDVIKHRIQKLDRYICMDTETRISILKSIGAMYVVWPQIWWRFEERLNDPIPVVHVLGKMLPASILRILWSSQGLQRIKNSFVCCTSTLHCKESRTKEFVLDAFERRALISVNYDSAFDHVMPVVLTETRSEGSSEEENIKADINTVDIIPIRIEFRRSDDARLLLPSTVASAIGQEMIEATNGLRFAPSLAIIIYFGNVDSCTQILPIGSCTLLVVDGNSRQFTDTSLQDSISQCLRFCVPSTRNGTADAAETTGTEDQT